MIKRIRKTVKKNPTKSNTKTYILEKKSHRKITVQLVNVKKIKKLIRWRIFFSKQNKAPVIFAIWETCIIQIIWNHLMKNCIFVTLPISIFMKMSFHVKQSAIKWHLNKLEKVIISKGILLKKIAIIHGKGEFSKINGSIWNVPIKAANIWIILPRPEVSNRLWLNENEILNTWAMCILKQFGHKLYTKHLLIRNLLIKLAKMFLLQRSSQVRK